MKSKSLRNWNIKLPNVKFAYKRSPFYITSYSLFEYESSLDLTPIPKESKVSFEAKDRAKEMKKLHEQVRAQIEKVNE